MVWHGQSINEYFACGLKLKTAETTRFSLIVQQSSCWEMIQGVTYPIPWLCDQSAPQWCWRLGFKTQLVHSAVNGYLTLFRAGEGEGGDEEKWRPTSVTCGASWLSSSQFSNGHYGLWALIHLLFIQTCVTPKLRNDSGYRYDNVIKC